MSGVAPQSEPAPPRWRTLGIARRIGYRLLPGDAFSYILHLRPREWPIMVAHTSIGFIIAIGARAFVRGDQIGAYLIMLLSWVGCLNAGTLALNSAFDRDEGDIGYLDAPPPIPKYLALLSIALMTVGQVLALRLGAGFAIAYAVCFAMSLAYSVPPVRLKAVAGADWAINIVGVGVLTPFAGWSASGFALRPEARWIMIGFGCLFGSLYPLTQIYQFNEDSSRGDRTLARILGVRASLLISSGAAALAFVSFAYGLLLAGPTVMSRNALVVAGAAWAVVLAPWILCHRRMAMAEHQRGMYRALAAWALTDVAMVVAFAV
ncbi:MAG TPA: UbiA family prenyltransferase [Gemmatimonadaceae bacterium]|nr:UbiA family prenyltransferase [Gemmatimonadaceae bacterium]